MSISKKLMTMGKSDPTYVDDVFSTYVYTGTGSAQAITNGIDLDGEGGLVWIKDRDNVRDHALHDTERGINRYLNSNQSYMESQSGTVSSYNADGFSMSTGHALVNGSGIDYVSWTFRKAPKFFDVVTYTGNGTNQTISHNLGSTPGFIVAKRTDNTSHWICYHSGLTSGSYIIQLDTDNAEIDMSSHSNTPWSSINGSSFTVGHTTGTFSANLNGATYVAYVFAHDDSDESIIKCGGFPGRYSTIDLGFEPQWVLMKPATSSGPWTMLDTMRGWTAEGAGGSSPLRANENSAEIQGDTSLGYITSTGFYVDNVGTADHIYMAIRRPNKPAEEFAATDLFSIDTEGSTGDGKEPAYRSTRPVDFALVKSVIYDVSVAATARLTQGFRLQTDLADAEGPANSDFFFDYMNGFRNRTTTRPEVHAWMWRRAPGFFDVVTYKGTGIAGLEVPHNLGVAPEMMWVKNRGKAQSWEVYSKSIPNTERLVLNLNSAAMSGTAQWNSTSPTDSVFTLGNDQGVNEIGNDYIAYLFASVPGISKVGSYTGTGPQPQTIDCGFSNGARFVLIKQTDGGGGDWRFFDTERGIIVGNDPMLTLNTANAQSAFDDYLVPESSGFRLVGNPSNSPGNEFIFYAIA